jgi:hypothetical protein
MNSNHEKGPSFRALSDKNELWRTVANREWCPGKDSHKDLISHVIIRFPRENVGPTRIIVIASPGITR